MLKRTKEALRQLLIDEILGSGQFWDAFDETVKEQIADSNCKLCFLKSKLYLTIGQSFGDNNLELELTDVEIWPSIHVTEDLGKEDARKVSARMKKFIKRLEEHKALIDKTYNLKGEES